VEGTVVSDPTDTTNHARTIPDGIVVQYCGRSDVGLVREHNEDNFLVADLTAGRRGIDGALVSTAVGERGLVLAVCDGMGGAAAGEVASQMAVDTIYEMLLQGDPPRDRDAFARRLVRAIEVAGARIFQAAKADRTRRGMGTTATVAGLIDEVLFVGQVGDSRAYVLRGDQFALITKDQSLVNQLIEAGHLTEEEAEAFEHSNIILQALGTTEEVAVDLTFLELRRGDRLLLCSDGLSGLVQSDVIKDVLQRTKDLPQAAQQLIEMANAGGGHDNITVVLAEVDGSRLREPTPDARVAYQQYPLPPDAPPVAVQGGPAAKTLEGDEPAVGIEVGTGVGRDDAGLPERSAGSRLWMIVLLVVLAIVLLGTVLALFDEGVRSDWMPEETTRVTIATPAAPTRSANHSEFALGRIIVRTDAEQGELYVNGERRAGEIADRMELSLPAGAYRLELRDGDTRIAEVTVTLEAGEQKTVQLTTPAGELP
jgi:protein phosphatase